MIHRFSLKNFFSFKETTTFNFEVDNKAPKNDLYFKTKVGRLSKIGVIIGANASGKTNLMKTLPFLRWLIVDSFEDDPSSPILVEPFVFNDKNSSATVISVDFEMANLLYFYTVKLTRERILEESLKVQSFTKKRTTQKTLFLRLWNRQLQKYDFDAKKYDFPLATIDLMRTNSSLIASALRANHKLSLDITNYWRNVLTNVNYTGYMDDDVSRLSKVFALYNSDADLKKKVEKVLSRFDLGLSSLKIIRAEDRQSKAIFSALVSHNIDGKSYDLPVEHESSGTKKLITLLRPILSVLTRGGIAVLDEIDVNLHPEIVNTLVSLFTSGHTNPLNAQFLFSTHSHIVLNNIDKYQVVITEKGKDGETIAWRLDENKDLVRNDENIYMKYVAGAYGGLPDIEL